jgi:hypothetical protein
VRRPIHDGRNPSSASAAGTREYDITSALNIPTPHTTPPATTASSNARPPIARAAPTHAPVVHARGSSPARSAAHTGRM